jgi:hypothetical protein
VPSRIPLLGAPAAPREARATPEVFGDARGLAALGGALEQVGETTARVLDNLHRSRATRAAREAGRALREAAAAALAERDPEKALATFEAARTSAREQALESAGDLPGGYRDLYEDLLDDDEADIALQVASAIRKQAVEDAAANDDWTLAQLADDEARAATPEQALAVRQRAAQVIRNAQQWDPVERDKRIKTYRDTVAGAALAQGLIDDPATLRQRIAAREGPFAEMPAKWLEEAELKAQRRMETLERAARAEERRARADADRDRADRKRTAQSELAQLGRPGGPGVSVDDVLERVDDLAGEADYWFGVAGRGGYIVDPEAVTPSRRAAITAEVARLEGLTPAQLAEEPLDAGKLGPELDTWRAKQEALRQRTARVPEGFGVRANARLKLLQVDPWFGAPVVETSLEDETAFWQRAELAVIAWADREKRSPDPVEQEAVLDQVVLDLVRERGVDIEPGPALGIFPRARGRLAPPTGTQRSRAAPGLPAGTRPHPTRAGVWVLPSGQLVERDE